MLPKTGTRLVMTGALLLALTLLVGGCGGGGGGGGTSSPAVSAGGSSGGTDTSQEPVGNRNCLQCHTSFPANMFTAGDPVETRAPYTDAGTGIGVAYQESVHNSPSFSPTSSDYVKCEDCHGNGRQHFGTGPIANWAPQADQCGVCHKTPYFDLASYQATAHYNSDNRPDAAFFQGAPGTDQATSQGKTLFHADGVTPVTKTQRIEECSVCHSQAQSMRAQHIADGNLAGAKVSCSNCHDAHSPALRNQPTLQDASKAPSSQVLRFKPQRVKNAPGVAGFGAIDQVAGTWIRPTLHFIYNVAGLTNDAGYANQLLSAGDHLRLSPERLCASCHTKGAYKHTRKAKDAGGVVTDVTSTHQTDVFTQFENSGHADHDQLAFHEFSLLSPLGSSHRPIYPVDMGKTTPAEGKNNYACNQCHHGIGAIDYLNGTQGNKTHGDSEEVGDAHILWGDSTITCITCHDPHEDAVAGNKNVRVPKYLSYNSWFSATNNPGAGNKRGGLNKMMDGTDIPANVGASLICLDCHQGRESGYTLFRTLTARGADYYAGTGTATGSFSNAHYFSGGADLWSKNAFEFFFDGQPAQYSNGIPQHQQLNCNGCHMAEATADGTEGGHSWKPRIETCRECHAGAPNFITIAASEDVDGDATTVTVYQSFGAVNAAATPAVTDQGLFNILRYELYRNRFDVNGDYRDGIWYDPGAYPYFFKVNADGTKATGSFTAWNTSTFPAAFNLGKLYKAGTAAYVHNYYYDSQILIDSLRAIGRTTNRNTGLAFVRPVTAPGGTSRNATDYRTIVIP